MEGFLEALKNGTEYDYICNHSDSLSRVELVNIIKEYIYAVQDMGSFGNKEDVVDDVFENLSEMYKED